MSEGGRVAAAAERRGDREKRASLKGKIPFAAREALHAGHHSTNSPWLAYTAVFPPPTEYLRQFRSLLSVLVVLLLASKLCCHCRYSTCSFSESESGSGRETRGHDRRRAVRTAKEGGRGENVRYSIACCFDACSGMMMTSRVWFGGALRTPS